MRDLHFLTGTLDLLAEDTDLLVRLRLLPALLTLQLLEEQVGRLGWIHGFSERVELDTLLEDADAVVVAANLIVRIVLGLGDVLVGVDVNVGLGDGSGKGGFASCEIILPEFLSFDLLDDGPGVVRLSLVVARDLGRVDGLGL